jgi:hypothetical protein
MIRTINPPEIRAIDPSQIQGGDIVMRRKKAWLGDHYGTALDGGLVAHTVPGRGKHVSTLAEFAEGKPVRFKRPVRTPQERYLAQQRAVADLGKPYLPAVANCEHDVTTVHSGRAYSPMLQSVVVGLALSAVLGAVTISKGRL